ncbi:MAG: hypothetical protein JOZ78_22485 [Chroococcidiopsidaceae cyanobacterium CP_BM_ER_R8_30]|nr:hypothetical protein [Chroococcidiopsidaceae cyanobacterium CP_BM_ER_R8_30]
MSSVKVDPVASSYLDERKDSQGNAEQPLADLAYLSDQEVDSLLHQMLAKEEVN